MKVPDVDVIEAQLRAIEAQAAKGGWDQCPELFALHDPGSGPRATRIISEPWPGGDSNFAGQLEAISLVMADGGKRRELPLEILTMLTPGLYGIAFSNEGWARIGDMTEDDLAEHEASGRSIADDPRGKEVRLVSAYCADTSAYMLMRERGKQADFVASTPDQRGAKAGGWQAGGRVFESMARMVAALLGDPFGLHAAGQAFEVHADAVAGPTWYRDLHKKGPTR